MDGRTHVVVAGVLVVGGVLSLFFGALAVSLGTLLDEPALSYLLPLSVLGVSLSPLAWLVLSRAGCVPHPLRPWALSKTTVWIDKTCVDQTNVAGFLETGIDTFVLRSCSPSRACY